MWLIPDLTNKQIAKPYDDDGEGGDVDDDDDDDDNDDQIHL